MDHPWTDQDIRAMQKALQQALYAAEADEVPVGAVIMHRDRLIAQAYNQVEMLKDPTAHAEILAITQAAAALEDWRLEDTTLYVTKEPCPMCAGAIMHARIPRVIWGVDDPQRGGAVSCFNILNNPRLNHTSECFGGLMEADCKALIKRFFQAKRQVNKSR